MDKESNYKSSGIIIRSPVENVYKVESLGLCGDVVWWMWCGEGGVVDVVW